MQQRMIKKEPFDTKGTILQNDYLFSKVLKRLISIITLSICAVLFVSQSIMVHAAERSRSLYCEIAYGELGKKDGQRYGARKGEAWCVYFAQWLARQCGLTSEEWPNIAGTNSLVYWFQKHGQWYPDMEGYYGYQSGIGYYETGGVSGYEPRPGDAIIVNNDGDASPEPEHTGVVVAVTPESITTIEGNISNKVVQRTYSRTTRHLTSGSSWENKRVWYIGFCSPKFDDDRNAPKEDCPSNCLPATYRKIPIFVPKTFDTALFSTDIENSPSTKIAGDTAYSLYTGKVFRSTKLSNGGCTWKDYNNASIFQIGYSTSSDQKKLSVINDLIRNQGCPVIIRLGDTPGISLVVIGVRRDVDVQNLTFDDFVVYYPYYPGFLLLSEMSKTEHWYQGLLNNGWSLICPYTGTIFKGFRVK